MGKTMSGGVFWAVCELHVTLGSLSAKTGGAVFLSSRLFGAEVSSTGACRYLGVGSWFQDGKLWENSHQLIFPGARNSLVVHCLGLVTLTAEAQADSWPGEPEPTSHASQPKGRGRERKKKKQTSKT